MTKFPTRELLAHTQAMFYRIELRALHVIGITGLILAMRVLYVLPGGAIFSSAIRLLGFFRLPGKNT